MYLERQVINQDANLELVRGAFDKHGLRELHREIEYLWQAWPANVHYPFEGRYINGTEMVPVSELPFIGAPLIKDITEVLEIPEDSSVGLNAIAPGVRGNFHTDKQRKTTIIYPTGDGFYDFAPDAQTANEVEGNYEKIALQAGDIVLADGEIFHRGNNTGSEYRRSMVFFTHQ